MTACYNGTDLSLAETNNNFSHRAQENTLHRAVSLRQPRLFTVIFTLQACKLQLLNLPGWLNMPRWRIIGIDRHVDPHLLTTSWIENFLLHPYFHSNPVQSRVSKFDRISRGDRTMNAHCFSHFPTEWVETGPPQVKLFHACNLTKLKAATHTPPAGRT